MNIIQVDAFTSTPFSGNPAAVCLLDDAADERWMQAVAMEMNLSETAFLYPQAEGYRLRWFTPTSEIDLCGHATLASAHVLFSDGHLAAQEVARFDTNSGPLTVVRQADWLEMNFPTAEPQAIAVPKGLLEALGIEASYVGQAGKFHLIEVAEEDTVRQAKPNINALLSAGIQAVILTAGGHNVDMTSRVFAPGVGIPEDPVTGSAHCVLAPYWANKLAKTTLSAYQASARGGELQLELQGERVLIRGQAVITMRGELLV